MTWRSTRARPWDKDYGLEENDLNVHPHIATVTYLCGAGGGLHSSTSLLKLSRWRSNDPRNTSTHQ